MIGCKITQTIPDSPAGAFIAVESYEDGVPTNSTLFPGLSKREAFAVAALSGLLSGLSSTVKTSEEVETLAASSTKTADLAVAYADALVEALNKGKGK